MRNYILGVLSGVVGALLYSIAPYLAWYFWANPGNRINRPGTGKVDFE